MKKTNPRDQQESDLPKLASPARRALAGAGYTRLEQLHGIGPNALDQLRRALAERGLSFADTKQSKQL